MSDSLDHYLAWRLSQPELGVELDFADAGLDEAALAAAAGRLDAALDALARLEAGAVANADEGRMVGHYWLRAPELAPDPALTAAITESWRKIESFAADLRSGRIGAADGWPFRGAILVGIGGSALGPQLVEAALTPRGGTGSFSLRVLDNTDPAGIADMVAETGSLSHTLILVVSKSGSTAETRNGMLELRAACERAGASFVRQAVAITCEGSALDQLAAREGWLARFPMWDWVGGRTSELSAVGLLPAALQGLDVDGMLAGARAMDSATRVRDVQKNPAALLALAWHHASSGTGAKDMVVLPYKDRLLLLSRYLQQLVMESLGKEKDLDGKTVEQGLAVYGNKGSTDQHAYVQQLRDGVANHFVLFVEVLKDRPGVPLEVEPGVHSGDYLLGFLLGTRAALAEKGRESITLTVPDVSARTLGALIALFERTVGFYATLININAYHQPGVEAGKKAAESVLAVQKKVMAALDATPRSVELIAEAIAAEPETVFQILRHLSANARAVAHAGGKFSR